jgi:hypothetical protein
VAGLSNFTNGGSVFIVSSSKVMGPGKLYQVRKVHNGLAHGPLSSQSATGDSGRFLRTPHWVDWKSQTVFKKPFGG